MERLEQRHQRLTVAAVVPVQALPSPETMLLRQRLERRLRAALPVVLERLPRQRAMARMPLLRAVAVAALYPPPRPAVWVVRVALVRSG
jgi:hypothetical protein